MSSATPSAMPPIRVYDLVAHGSSQDGLEIAQGRHIDLSIAELAQLATTLGPDGLQAFCLYLEHLTHVEGPDGRLALGVPDFSARWVLECSIQTTAQRGGTPLGRNAAQRGHAAVDKAGLIRALPNKSAPGQGSRGRTWRGVLNPHLVLIRGGEDIDVEAIPQPIRGRIPGGPVPLSREPGKRERGTHLPTSAPLSQFPGKREDQSAPRFPGNWESGNAEVTSAQVSPAFPETGKAGNGRTTSEVGVVNELLSGPAGPGLIAQVLIPALRRDSSMVLNRIYPLFNDPGVAERAEPIAAAIGLSPTVTTRPHELSAYLADVLLGLRDPAEELARLNVTGGFDLPPHELSERLVVGVLIGLGMRRVGAWGAWLYKATRADFQAKPNSVIDQFVAILRRLPDKDVPRPATARADDSSAAAATQQPGPTVAPRPAPSAPAGVQPETDEGESLLLDEETIARHIDDARAKWPWFCRPGTPNADDPVARSRLVRMHLLDEAGQNSERRAV